MIRRLHVLVLPVLTAVYGSAYCSSDRLIQGPADFLVSWVAPAIAVVARLAFVYVKPPEGRRVTREGVPPLSPPLIISLVSPLDSRSIVSADSASLRLSKTPTTTQALRCFSGLPLFMVNSIDCPSRSSDAALAHIIAVSDLSGHFRQKMAKKSRLFQPS